jgi:hypothetical protein
MPQAAERRAVAQKMQAELAAISAQRAAAAAEVERARSAAEQVTNPQSLSAIVATRVKPFEEPPLVVSTLCCIGKDQF